MGGATLHESFAASFDGRSVTSRSFAATRAFHSAGQPPTGAYGFGTLSIRFKDHVQDSTFGKFGTSNAATIPLTSTAPVPLDAVAFNAPSRVLPAYAAAFEVPLGQSFGTTVLREAPAGPNGEKQYYVLPKEGRGGEAKMSVMAAPRGAGSRSSMHEIMDGLMTPAERREALVFNKCRERAEHALRKAASEACRQTLTMKRNHPNGVLGVESAACPETIVYARERAAMLSREAKAAVHAAGRHDHLARRRDSQLPAPMLQHDSNDTTQARLFPRLGKVDVAASRRCERDFVLWPGDAGSNGCRSWKAEHQNNMDAGGRSYNIISGIQRPVLPTRTPAGEPIAS
jgi:hypothetical protein